MTDIVDRATRSRMMSGIRGRDTKPEVTVRKYLHAHGLRYRIAPKNLPGKPDIVLPKYRTVVFVHGCFWHRHQGCKYAATPSSNVDFWNAKFAQNIERDRLTKGALKAMGWSVHTIWVCKINERSLAKLVRLVSTALDKSVTHHVR